MRQHAGQEGRPCSPQERRHPGPQNETSTTPAVITKHQAAAFRPHPQNTPLAPLPLRKDSQPPKAGSHGSCTTLLGTAPRLQACTVTVCPTAHANTRQGPRTNTTLAVLQRGEQQGLCLVPGPRCMRPSRAGQVCVGHIWAGAGEGPARCLKQHLQLLHDLCHVRPALRVWGPAALRQVLVGGPRARREARPLLLPVHPAAEDGRSTHRNEQPAT